MSTELSIAQPLWRANRRQVSPGFFPTFQCEYTDLRGLFTSVPAGQYLHVTNVLITPRDFSASDASDVLFVHQRSSEEGYRESRAFSSDRPDATMMSSTMLLLITSSPIVEPADLAYTLGGLRLSQDTIQRRNQACQRPGRLRCQDNAAVTRVTG